MKSDKEGTPRSFRKFLLNPMKAFNLGLRGRIKRFILDYLLFENKLKSLLGWSFIFWIVILRFNPYYYADLRNIYTDHLRHEYVSWAFLQVGFKVFSTPLGEIASQVYALHPHLTWEMHPSLYPLGMVLYFLPFGILSNLGILNDILVHKLMVFSFLVCAYLCIYHFTLEWKESKLGLCAYVLAPILFYLSTTFWAMNGFYDVIPVLLIILSIRAHKRNEYFEGVLFLAGAIFMHYRALMYFPLLIYLLYRLWRRNKTNVYVARRYIAIVVVFITGLVCSYTFYLSFIDRKWRIPTIWQTSPVYLLDPKDMYLFFLFSAVTLGVWLYLFRKGAVLSSAILGLFWTYISLTSSWGPWHCLFFFPCILLAGDKQSKECIFLWLLLSMYFLGGLIDPSWIVSIISKMFSG